MSVIAHNTPTRPLFSANYLLLCREEMNTNVLPITHKRRKPHENASGCTLQAVKQPRSDGRDESTTPNWPSGIRKKKKKGSSGFGSLAFAHAVLARLIKAAATARKTGPAVSECTQAPMHT